MELITDPRGTTVLNRCVRVCAVFYVFRRAVLPLLPEGVGTKIDIPWPLNVPPSLANLDLSKELRIRQRCKDAAAFDHQFKINKDLITAGVMQKDLLIWPDSDTFNRWEHKPNQAAKRLA